MSTALLLFPYHREVELELDRIGYTQHYRDSGLVDAEILEGERGGGLAIHSCRRELRIYLPCGWMRDTPHCEVANQVERPRARRR